MTYAITTFIDSEEMLTKFFKACRRLIKDDGYLFIAEFNFTIQPCDDWFFEMYVKSKTPDNPGGWPKEFEPYNFYICTAPDVDYVMYHIPANTMMKSGMAAGFDRMEYRRMYPNPTFKDHPMMVRFLGKSGCDAPDYILKLWMHRHENGQTYP
jgi:hypothetical protein